MLSSVTCASRCACVCAAETLAPVTQQELLGMQGPSRDFSHPPLGVCIGSSSMGLCFLLVWRKRLITHRCVGYC